MPFDPHTAFPVPHIQSSHRICAWNSVGLPRRRWPNLTAEKSVIVVVEATASYHWFVELVEPLAEKVVLANPKKLRVIAESTKKTDRLDAQVLAEFLARDMIPESYMPTPRQRQHRALVRHRQYIRGRMTSVRCKIRQILADYNTDRKDLFSAQCGPAYLKQVPLSDADRFVIKQLWTEFEDHQAGCGPWPRRSRRSWPRHRIAKRKPGRSSRQPRGWEW